MKILAIDIGGTTTRYGLIPATSLQQGQPLAIARIATQQDGITSFDELLSGIFADPTSGVATHDSFDAIALSVPGPVYGHRCKPPNIPWDIDIHRLQQSHTVFMLNDFAAQAYACLLRRVSEQFVICRSADSVEGQRSGIIGAGTGLGHCTVIRANKQYHLIPSEGGHATFAFIGDQEQAFADYLQQKLNIDYCVNDHVVNGRGLVILHEFLTGDRLTAAEIFARPQQHHDTLKQFSRFYARVARNFCLSNCLDETLIISGGLVVNNPQLITDYDFFDEFMTLTTEAYRPMLENLSIVLNRQDEIGIYGAAYYAMSQLSTD